MRSGPSLPPRPCLKVRGHAGLTTGLGLQRVRLGVWRAACTAWHNMKEHVVAQGEGALAHRTAYNCLQLRQRLTLCSAAEPARMPRLVS